MTGSCSICISEPDTPVCPPCGHVYCSACLDNHTASYTTIEQGLRTSWCPNCRFQFPLGEPDSSLQYVSPKIRPFVAPAIRRLFPGDGSAESELDSDEVPDLCKLERRLRSESKANYRRRKEIERLNEKLRVMEDGDRRAKDDLAACQRNNSRLRDQLRAEQERDQWEELDPNLKAVVVVGCLTIAAMWIYAMVVAYKVIPFQTLFNWCMVFLHTVYRLWVEIGYPLLLELFNFIVIGCLTIAVMWICAMVVAYKVIPFQTLFKWYIVFLHTVYRLWVEIAYPLLLELFNFILTQVRDRLKEMMDKYQ